MGRSWMGGGLLVSLRTAEPAECKALKVFKNQDAVTTVRGLLAGYPVGSPAPFDELSGAQPGPIRIGVQPPPGHLGIVLEDQQPVLGEGALP